MKKHSLTFLVAFLVLVLSSCSAFKAPSVETGTITEFEKYGHAKLDITIEKMFNDGYELGDTVNLYFSNGYEFKDVPFFNGYYVKKGEVMLRAYPTHKEIAACINYGKIYEVANLKVGDTVIITLAKKGGALDTQILNSLSYSNDRNDFSSNEVFANFREITTTGVGKGKLYRSASPINNENNRASTADTLMHLAGIKSVINLADSYDEINSYIAKDDFNSPYYQSLYTMGNVIALNMPVDFSSESFQEDLTAGIKKLVTNNLPTPILIHCTEGKDRAGFTSALLEALMGASYDEIVSDYMMSYKNYYGITKENDPKRYDVIVRNNIDEMLKVIADVSDVKDITTQKLINGAKMYLIGGGMGTAEVDSLISLLK